MTSLRTRLLAGAVSVVPLLTAGTAMAQSGAVATLLQQADYWRGQNRPDRALQTLERVLAVEPNNVDALAAAASAEAEAGNRAAADGYLARLRQVAPADTRLSNASRSVRGATADPGAIAEARRLAQSGQQGQAVERYRQLFGGGTPPDNYAIEYYQTLAGTQQGYAEARDAMERLVEGNPGNRRLALAYAQILTYREGSRPEGVRRLEGLAQQPEVAANARAALRDALLWEGPDPAAAPAIESYLRSNPNDAALTQRLAEIRNPSQGPADEIGAGRIRGFDALNAGRLAEAAQQFESVLSAQPRDADALGGLGVVRLRQGRTADARRLLADAIAADPQDGRRRWGRALDGASFTSELTQARNLIQRDQLDQAETILRRAAQRESGERADAEALLGDLALRRNDPSGAEQHYRAALSRRPGLAPALAGMYDALQQQGRFAEAEQLAASRGDTFASTVGARRAESLRTEAARAMDPQSALALLRAAQASDPQNPWIRLDLARSLARQGQAAEGSQLVNELATDGRPEAIHAAALFAAEQGQTQQAAQLIERIPVRQRSADQTRLLRQAQIQAEIAAAAGPAAYGRRDEARRRLMALAARPDPSGETAALAVRALTDLGDRPGAMEAARIGLAVNRNAPPTGRIALANALLAGGLEQEAAQVASQIGQDQRLSADEQRQLAGLRAGVAIRASDRLNEEGNQAAAYDRLAPALAQDPQNVDANLALARLYRGAREPRQAQRIAEAVLGRDPRNIDARIGAADAAIAAGDTSRAEALLAEGRSFAPNDPRFSLLEGRLARATGDGRRARRALLLAAEQRRGQLGGNGAGFAPGTTAFPQQAEGADLGTPGQGGNPFRRVSLAGPGAGPQPFGASQATMLPGDPMLGEINRELASIEDEVAPRISVGPVIRGRSGDAGLDKLTEFSGQADISTSVPGIGGRVTLRAQPTSIDAGDMDTNVGTLRRFGSNALAYAAARGLGATQEQVANTPQSTLQQFAPRDSSAAGVALGLGYARGIFSADVGSTPLGFRQKNVVGGLEVAPELGGGVRLRLTGERRAVTDSLLSWAGMRDPVTDMVWGGVTRNTGRGQLEFGSGNTTFYVGGGYSFFEGKGVADNNRIEAGAGMSHALIREPNRELVTGLDFVYQTYDKNLRFFTLGHGGYYSPQSYLGVSIPIDYRAHSGPLSYRLGGTVGFASWREDRAPIFPTDGGAQRAMEIAAQNFDDVAAFYPGQSQTEFTGGLRGDLEYQVTPVLRLGAALRYDKSADWSEARGLLYARYRLDQ